VNAKEDKYLLLAGERRFLARKQLDLATIPDLIRDLLPHGHSGHDPESKHRKVIPAQAGSHSFNSRKIT
jgi:hypothetical protein